MRPLLFAANHRENGSSNRQVACVIQNPILAYILRVSPELARVRIEQAIAARGKEFTACNHSLFQIGSEIHYDPLLEEIGVHSLDDPDPEVAGTAATLLGKFASRAAETRFGAVTRVGAQSGQAVNQNWM